MFDINDNELLARARRYELQRENFLIRIDVLEIIAGNSSHKFQALPTGPDGQAPKEYCGFGETEVEALQECLRKIKNVDNDVLMKFFVIPLYPDIKTAE